MKGPIVIVLLTMLTGCDFAVHDYEIEGYEKACKNSGGIAKIKNLASGVKCKNGDWFKWWQGYKDGEPK